MPESCIEEVKGSQHKAQVHGSREKNPQCFNESSVPPKTAPGLVPVDSHSCSSFGRQRSQ